MRSAPDPDSPQAPSDGKRIAAIVLYAFAAIGFSIVGAIYYGPVGAIVGGVLVVAAAAETLRR